jgi:pimeloyl-ACP methyl ester carboxylesterase
VTINTLLVGGHRLAYLDEGSGPPILLIHGIPTSSLLWRHVIPVLAQRHRVIAPDMLNDGKSDKPVDADV